MIDRTESVAEALADEARRHREDIESGRIARMFVEVKIGQDGAVRTRPARVAKRYLQSGGELE
jgi:hypothetical protein